jgi:hypothetical protein
MSDETPASPPRNRAERRAEGRSAAPAVGGVTTRSQQIKAERAAAARSAAKSKPQLRK